MRQRPITAKTVYYSPDGYGRDTYIQYNNGGLTVANTSKSNFDRGSFPFRREYKLPNTTIDSKTLLYHSDGSGRDSYITSFNGGLHAANEYGTSLYHTFSSTLRGNEINSMLRTRNASIKSITSPFSSKAKDNWNDIKAYQKNQIERLSQPKRRKITLY